jgi:uroporphyrinogen decarboxylase
MVMTPKERETAVFNGEKPDRVPIWQINGIVASQTMGYQWKDVRCDAKLAVDLMRKFARMAGTDALGHTCVEPNGPFIDLGMEMKFVDNNYSNILSHYFNEAEDVDTKPFYDPRNEKECPMLWKTMLSKEKLMAEVEDEYITQSLSWSIMTSAGHLRGVEQLLMDFLLEPELAQKVMKRTGRFIDDLVRTGLDFGCDAVYIADPSASGSLINADTFREFCTPYIKPVIEGWKKDYGAYVYLHVCGETEPVVEAFKEIKPSLFSFDYMTNLVEIKKVMNNEVVIAGNLNPMDVIWQGTPESVIEHAKDCIAKADGCRFYLATGCETPRDTPIENLQAMKTAVEKYGRYD